jgi:hypothetical protein
MEGVSLLEILIWVTLSVQNISHPLTEKKYNPNFSFFLKEKIYIIKYGDSHDRMVVGFITTYAISAHHPIYVLLE